MTTHKVSARTSSYSNAALHLAALLFVLLSAAAAPAQTSATDGKTPTGLAPGSPAGSYSLSGFETVNLFNGGLNFRLPLLKVGGRGGAGYAVTLPVEQKWTVKAGQQTPSGVVPLAPIPNWWQGIRPGYGPGVLQGRRGSYEDGRVEDTVGCDGVGEGCSTVLREIDLRILTRLTFTTSDGTEYELRDRQTDGAPHADVWYPQTGDHDGFSRGKVFLTADGTSATFISDSDITDYVAPNMTQSQRIIYPSGYLLLADGSRYRIDSGKVSWLRDRNGNRVTFSYDGNSRVSNVTDQLGRQVAFTYDDGARHYDEIVFKGFGGAARSIRVWYDYLANRLRPGAGYSIQTYHQLFPFNSASTTLVYNPGNRVSEVELPDGRRYKLYYNPYGELARVVLPTGGAVEYDWSGGADLADAYIFRYVTKRRIYPNGAALESETEYVRAFDGVNSSVEEKTTDSSGALVARGLHFFYGDAAASMVEDPARPSAISYGKWKEGREYRSEAYDIVGGTPVLKRVAEQTWQQPAAGATWPLAGQGETDDAAKPNGPQLTQVKTTLSDTNQVSKQTFAYDLYGNRTDSWEYDYGATAGTAGPLVRHTQTAYLRTNNGAAYDTLNPDATAPDINATFHVRGLPVRQSVYDAAGVERARTVYEYDNYTTDSRHAALAPRANITGLCDTVDTTNAQRPCVLSNPTSMKARGNVTGATSYADASALTGAVTTSTQYDVAGNVVKSIDARGNDSTVDYADSFCNGSTCGGAYTANTYAFPTSATSPVPDPTGQYGSATALVTSTIYDFWTGLTYSTTDANSKTTTLSYADGAGILDPLDRPKSVTRPDGGKTDFNYGDAAGNLYVQVLADLDTGRRTESRQYFDGVGRSVRALTWEGQDATNPWLTTDTQYDALGRAWRSSSPYRSAGPAGAVNPSGRWVETTFDALGRAKQVKTTADGAAVTTAYDGNKVLVTDQAGAKRISSSDALGRLTDVWEVTSGDAATVAVSFKTDNYAGYRSTYTYDALGNLRAVAQGAQSRTFVYDSLGRLTSATNPESGAVGYAYDPNGNLQTRTDARGVTATYAYDKLNRNTTVTYAGGGTTTPAVSRFYDSATNGRGRPYRTEAAATAQSTFTTYDVTGRPTQYQQKFWVAGAWGQAYAAQYAYNKAGGITSETYPSGHAVSYQYGVTGRLGDNGAEPAFKGNLGDGLTRAYASEVRYEESGGREQERFGTDTAVYNKALYNNRGQLAEIRVSTYPITAAGHETDWNRGAIINHYSNAAGAWGATGGGPDNNGNLQKQDVYIPDNDAVSGYSLSTLFFSYDALNRIKQARESYGGSNIWVQYFDYDRWGNRTVNAALTTGSAPEPQFSVDASTNRLGVPAGRGGVMTYDPSGNLTNDTYQGGSGGGGARAYDAENRMTQAQFVSGQSQTAVYTYDADGRRVKRNTGAGGEVWQVYGAGGELLAEYAAGASPASPQKEYGYRSGELLVTAEPGAGGAQSSQEGVVWSGAVNVNVSGNSLSKPLGGQYAWDAGAISTKAIASGDGYVEFTAAEADTNRMCGLSLGDTDQSDSDIDFAWYLYRDGTAYVSEGGTIHGPFGAYAAGDRFRVSVEGGAVKYRKNDAVMYTSALAPKYPLLVDASLSKPGATVNGVGISGDLVENVTWANASGVAVSGNSLTRDSSPIGWTAGASSTQSIATGDGYVEFTAAEYGTNRICGLSRGDADRSDTDIDFGLYLYRDGGAYVQEGGALRGLVTTYSAGDRFRVSVEGGVVKYRKNGAVVYTSSVSPQYPLLVDTSLSMPGGTIINAVVKTGSSSAGAVEWLVADQLGTPRMSVDRTGSLSGVRRHDYLPFGEEIAGDQSWRTAARGYAGDAVRQKFTKKERDGETGLDYFLARYYSSAQGRFTSPDEFTSGPGELYSFVDDASANPTFYADLRNPQSLNKYQYAYNNPLRYIDPDGHEADDQGQKPAPGIQIPVTVPITEPLPIPIIPSGPDFPDPDLMPDYAVPPPDTQKGQLMDLAAPLPKPEPPDVNKSLVPEGWTVYGAHVSPLPENKDEPPGRTSAGRPTDKYGRPLGPSGKPIINNPNLPSKKRAKDAARDAGQGAPMKHPTPRRGDPHFHPTRRNGEKKRDGTHYNYPRKGFPEREQKE